MAWLTGYSCRKRVPIAGETGAGTNYQRKLTVHSGSGSNSPGVAYLGGNAENFPNDIRFTDNDGETELEHFCCDLSANPAIFWIEVTDDLGSNVDIYIYFGKTAGASASNIANTFLKGDDFERGNDGDEVGGDWTEGGGVVEISTEQAYSGTRSMKLEGGAAYPQAQIAQTAAETYAINFKFYKEDASQCTLTHGDGSTRVRCRGYTDENIEYYDLAWNDTGSDVTPDTWEEFEVRDIDWAANTYDIIHEGSSVQDDATMETSASSGNIVNLIGLNSSGNDTYIDNYFVRKWQANEPVVGTPDGTEIQLSISISASGALALAAKRTLSGAMSVSGTGALASTSKAIYKGTLPISGTGTLTPSAKMVLAAILELSGAGSLAMSAKRILSTTISMAGQGTLALVGEIKGLVLGAMSMVGTGAISIAGKITRSAQLSIAGSGALAMSPSKILKAALSMSGVGSLTASAKRILRSTLSLSGAGTLSATGKRVLGAILSLTGTGTLALSGVVSKLYDIALTAQMLSRELTVKMVQHSLTVKTLARDLIMKMRLR